MPTIADGNQLASETSPYLLQHADNPVHWRAWGPEALAEAARDDKPILLSIGYSACHWCHVMAHESFENRDTAKVMNQGFVNIKVDREERPDLDQIYQLAHQMLTQRQGGWPLTMFLTPDGQVPFFGGTYFPGDALHGMPAFRDVLSRVLEFYRNNGDEIADQSATILDIYRQSEPAPPPGVQLDESPLAAARQALLAEFDARFGGFGGAPKFPMPGTIDVLLRYWHANSQPPEPDLQALYMATRTLQSMAQGGLYDQLGGGFFRYSVDAAWQVPHFEKMLFDNVALLALYAQAYKATDEPLYWRVANETADWLEREMLSPEGGFYSALDADSEGVEGAFYLWTREDFVAGAGDDADMASRYYGIDAPANFEDLWHLVVAQDDDSAPSPPDSLGDVKARLFALREQRPRPFRDTKILTSWNGLAVRACAIAARHLSREDLADIAAGAADFLSDRLATDGRLKAVYKDGRARFNAYLDDYAFVLDGLLELMQTRFRPQDLGLAINIAESLLTHFADGADGGFYFTSDDHEALLHRMKPFADTAMPSGNGVAARALTRLGHLIGESRYLDAAERAVRAAWEPLCRIPHAHGALLTALQEIRHAPDVVVIRAPADALDRWRQAGAMYAPRRMMFAISDDAGELPGLLGKRVCRAGGVAYLCRGQTCEAPLATPEALLIALR